MLKQLEERNDGKCELCNRDKDLKAFELENKTNNYLEDNLAICKDCGDQLNSENNAEYWMCLNESIWSEAAAVKIMSYRILDQHKSATWAQELLDQLYLDEYDLLRAQTGLSQNSEVHFDSNGVLLKNGDAVTLIKDLKVKGGGFTAKRGTAVRNIKLVQNDPKLIEGKVEGQTIYILTEFVKK